MKWKFVRAFNELINLLYYFVNTLRFLLLCLRKVSSSRSDFEGERSVVAETAGITGGQLDETSLAPGSAPGVLDGPDSAVVDGGQEDTVVEGITAVGEDTGLVERPVGGVDGDGDGLVDELVGQILAVTGVDVVVVSDGEVTTVEGAELVLGLVGVLGLSGEPVLDDVSVGSVHKTTLAAEVALEAGAIDELLLGVGSGGGALNPADGLNGGDGGESPARSARSLVLDGGDLAGPVDGLEVLNGLDDLVGGLAVGEEGEVGGGELFLGQVHELVLTEGVGLAGGVDFFDVILVVEEDADSVGLEVGTAVFAAELVLPGGEVVHLLLGEADGELAGGGGEEVGRAAEEGNGAEG